MLEEQITGFADLPYRTVKDVPASLIQEIFDLWVSIHRNSGRGRSPVLSEKRSRLIAKGVVSHGAAACREAIQGCALSDWHMGKNPSGKKYDDIELILRDAQKIEKFSDLWLENQSGGGFLD